MNKKIYLFEVIEFTKIEISGSLEKINGIPQSCEQFGKALDFILSQTLLSLNTSKYYEDKYFYYYVGIGDSIYYIFQYDKENESIYFNIYMYCRRKKRNLTRLYDRLYDFFKPEFFEYHYKRSKLREYIKKDVIRPLIK